MFVYTCGSAGSTKEFRGNYGGFKFGRTSTRSVSIYKCQLIRDNTIQEKIIEAVGGMNIDAYEYFAANTAGKKAFVVFSTSKFIMNPVDDGYVYNYVKVKINEENKVTITAQYVKPNTLEVTMDDKFFTDVSDGKNEKAGAFFYKQK